jgi:hypothetical protein
MNLLPSVLALGLAALAGVALAWRRPSPPDRRDERRAAARALALAVAAQGVHFAEEAATGFEERLPTLFGMPPLSFTGFVVFNSAWLAIWIAAIPAIRSPRPVAFFAAWFLAIAGMLNGVAHPLLAIVRGGYFPGLVSSPVSGLASLWLWLRLRRATESRRES